MKLKSLFHFLKQRFFKQKQKTQTPSEEELYSLDEYQLKNLLDKNINFDFFYLKKEDSFSDQNKLDDLNKIDIKQKLKTAQLKTKEEILSQLKDESFEKPIVLICKTGIDSKVLFKELRDKGFFNVYFMTKGLQSLRKDV